MGTEETKGFVFFKAKWGSGLGEVLERNFEAKTITVDSIVGDHYVVDAKDCLEISEGLVEYVRKLLKLTK